MKVKQDVQAWAKANVDPTNPESTFIKREWDVLANKRRRERETLLDHVIDVDAETDAEKLRKEFDIQIAAEETVGAQVSSFCLQQGAYLEFKKSSTVARMLQHFNRFTLRALDEEVREQAHELLKLDYTIKPEDLNITGKPRPKQSKRNWFNDAKAAA